MKYVMRKLYGRMQFAYIGCLQKTDKKSFFRKFRKILMDIFLNMTNDKH